MPILDWLDRSCILHPDDTRPCADTGSGNVLPHTLLHTLPAHQGKWVIDANGNRLGEKALLAANVVFNATLWAIQPVGKNGRAA